MSNPPMISDVAPVAPTVEAVVSAEPVEPAVPAVSAADQAASDAVALAAVDEARAAAVEVADAGTVGEHLGATVEPGGLIVHSFGSSAKGYRGWHWAVSLAHVPGAEQVTVCDVVMLPGAESIMAPVWVPWSNRLAPGDIGPGDELPYQGDDPLLVPGYTVTDPADDDQQLFWELGLGRERVIGSEGLKETATRWERGPHGPTAETAIQASAPCLTCGYFLPVSGLLRQHFGVCTNEWSPADGSVVTMDFGCGAHSETDLELPAPEPLAPHILDETVIDAFVVERGEAPGLQVAAEEAASPVDEEVSVAAQDAAVNTEVESPPVP